MLRYGKSTIDFFQMIYARGENAWGEHASDLAVEAASILKSSGTSKTMRVLDLGCGNGRDSIFFAKHGWEVTSIDCSDEALRSLESRAREERVEDRIKLVRADFEKMPLEGQYDLVISNYSLHFLEADQRRCVLRRLMQHTSPNGIHAVMAMRDMNEEIIGELKDYCYLSSGELSEIYDSWNQLDSYDGFYPDEHPGTPAHQHSVGIMIAQKPGEMQASWLLRLRSYWRSAVLSLGVVALSVILCTLGYSSLNTVSGSIANVWPGAIFQVVSAASLGGWGLLSTLVAGIITNAINVKTLYAILAFIPANFIQSFIPAYYYRRVLRRGGWNSRIFRFFPFMWYGVIIPNLLGSLLGAGAVCWFGGAPYWQVFLKWFVANVPIAIILGWPLFRFVIPTLVEEGWTVKGWWR